MVSIDSTSHLQSTDGHKSDQLDASLVIRDELSSIFIVPLNNFLYGYVPSIGLAKCMDFTTLLALVYDLVLRHHSTASGIFPTELQMGTL